MGTMTVGLVIAGVVIVGIVLLVLRWRMASGEQQALRHYQNALDTLRTVSDRMESSRPAVSPSKQADEEPGTGSTRRPAARVDLTRADLTRGDLTPEDGTPAVGTPAYRISETRVSTPSRGEPARNGSSKAPHVVARTGADRASSVGFSPEPERASAGTVVGPGTSDVSTGHDPLSKTGIQPVIVFEEDDTVVEPGDLGSSGPYRAGTTDSIESPGAPTQLPSVFEVAGCARRPRCGRRDSCRRGGCPWCNVAPSHDFTTGSFSYHRNNP